MLKNYLKIAWRNLVKNKGFSFINIMGLAIGMAVAIMIGLWVNDELSFDTYHKNYERLVQAQLNQTFNEVRNTSPAVSLPLGPELQANYTSDFKHVSLASWNFEHILARGTKKIIDNGLYVEAGFPEMFSLEMIAGSYEKALTDPNSIVLAQSLAKSLFADNDPMGQTLRVDDNVDMKVTGIFKDLPFNTTLTETKFLMPWSYYSTNVSWVNSSKDNWNNHSFQLFAQLAEGADLQTVSNKIRDIEKNNTEASTENPEYLLHPMAKWHLYSQFKDGKNTGGRIQYVWIFAIIGGVVLFLACINFMNLSTARSEKRAKEVGVRKTVGSNRRQLIIQFLSESFMVVFFAMILSLLLVQMALPAFNELSDKQVSIPLTDAMFWFNLIGFSIFTGLVAGSYPAFYLSSFRPLDVLKSSFRMSNWAATPRKILVVVQFTVSVTLIIGTLVVFNQIQHAKNRPTGYERDGLIQISMNTPGLEAKYDVIRQDLLNTGVVEDMTQSGSPATGVWSNQIGFSWEGLAPDAIPMFGYIACTHDYGNTVDWKIVEGRDFSREYSTDTSAFILNQAAVKLTGMTDIIGKTINKNDKDYKVIGVVEDLVMESPYSPIRPTVWEIDYTWANIIMVRLRSQIPLQEALKKVESVFAVHDSGSPFAFEFVDENYDKKFDSEERIGKLSSVFGLLAIFISCLGLFGLSAYMAERRTKEIGIRKVLGASVAHLWAMLSKEFVVLVVISCVLATPLAWYFLSDWLTSFDYRIALEWWVFVLAGVLAILVTLATVSFQSIKAAVASPINALKSE